MNTSFKNTDEYIAAFPDEIRILLEQIRSTIKAAAPEAEETINYGMPTFKFHGNLVHFAAYKKHIGFYPAPSGLTAFKDEISKYKYSKGTLQFPLDKEIPLELISNIVKFRMSENRMKAKKGKK